MTVEVKICGLTTPAAMQAALDAAADYVGLVFFEKSPRNVSLEAAGELSDLARERAKIVALVVDAGDDLIDQIMPWIAPDIIQLHGKETPARAAEIKRRTGAGIMKAVTVETAADAAHALAFADVADMILFDAKPPKEATRPGGNGVAFDWRALDDVKGKVPYMLSGGLTPATVAAAVRATGATRVDVSSGVESAPGEKDADLIRAFIANAKAA